MNDTYDDRPLPFWLRQLLNAHKSGITLPAMPHGGRHGLSKAESGMLLAGCSRVEEAVFRLRYLGQESERSMVDAELSDLSEQWAKRKEFAKVHCPDCLTRLIKLVVDEETLSQHHHIEAFRARYMGISRGVWKSRYDRPHAQLKGQVEKWAANAVGYAVLNIYG